MAKTSLFIITALFLSMVFSSIQAYAPVQSNEAPTDGSQLSTEPSQLCVTINDTDGDNMYWEIWQDGVLLENGTPFSYPTHTYTFNNCTTPHHAYWSSSTVPLKMTGDTEFSCSNYTNISIVDDLNVTTNAASSDYTHHHFLFNISEDTSTITNIDVNWHGYAGAYLGGAKPKWYWDATMYFDTDAPGWYTADSTALYTTDTPYEEWINYSLHHDLDDWLDDDGILEIAIQNTYAGQPSIVHTDYIEVVVTYRTGGDPNGTYCTSDVSWWNNDTCEEWWTWNTTVYDGITTSSETYTFQNMPCVLSGEIHPENNSINICPCADSICVGVGELYDAANMTVYGREQGASYWNIWNHYENISDGTYCFCMDGITPTIPAHAIGHSHTQQNVTVVDTWHNITFDHGEAEHIDCTPATGICKVEQYGHYDVEYWCVVQDMDANPTGNKMAIRILQNGTDEVDGSYRESTFSNQGYERHMVGFVHEIFVPDTTLNFQYIGDDTDQSIDTDGTWSTDNINFYAEIMRMDNEEHQPLEFNTTYEWYVNVSEYSDSTNYNISDTYSFTTAPDNTYCSAGTLCRGDVSNNNVMGIIGIIGVFGLLGFLLNNRRKK